MGEVGRPTLPGLDEACRALARGQAVVVPNPSPMTYGIVATSPRAVNALKGRPLDQSVAVSLHHDAEWNQVAPCIDVAPDLLGKIVAMLRLRLSLLVPVRDTGPYPDWISPAVSSGYLAMFSGRWAPLAQSWDQFRRLYGSSANRTGQLPAASAVETVDIAGGNTAVVDGDALRELGGPHAASSIVGVAPDGQLSLYRHGAQDAAAGIGTEDYLQGLAALEID